MQKIKVEFPVPDKILESIANAKKITVEQALTHIQDLIQNTVSLMTPGLLTMLEKAEAQVIAADR